MAQNVNELFSTAAGKGSGPRVIIADGAAQPKSIAAAQGTIAPLTAMAYNTATNFWVIWATGGANGTGTISGFMGLDGHVAHATDETTAVILLGGQIHLSDIPVVGGTLAQIKAAIISSDLSKKWIVQGMENFR